MELAALPVLLNRYWRLIAVLALLGAGVGVGLQVTHQSYVSGSSVLVQGASDVDRQLLVSEPDRFVKTLSRVTTSGPTLAVAAAGLHDGSTVGSLKAAVSVSGGDASNVLDISVSAPSATAAEDRARAVTSAFLAATPGRTSLLEEGGVAAASSRYREPVAGLIVGIALAVLLLVVRVAVRRPVFHPQDLEDDRGAEVLPYVVDLGQRPGGAVDDSVTALAALLTRAHTGRQGDVLIQPAGASGRAAGELLLERLESARDSLLLRGLGRQGELAPAPGRWWSSADVVDVPELSSDGVLVVVAEQGATPVSELRAVLARGHGLVARVLVVVVSGTRPGSRSDDRASVRPSIDDHARSAGAARR